MTYTYKLHSYSKLEALKMFLWLMFYVRYYLKCKLNPVEKERPVKGMKFGSLASGKIFYEGMQSALRSDLLLL